MKANSYINYTGPKSEGTPLIFGSLVLFVCAVLYWLAYTQNNHAYDIPAFVISFGMCFLACRNQGQGWVIICGGAIWSLFPSGPLRITFAEWWWIGTLIASWISEGEMNWVLPRKPIELLAYFLIFSGGVISSIDLIVYHWSDAIHLLDHVLFLGNILILTIILPTVICRKIPDVNTRLRVILFVGFIYVGSLALSVFGGVNTGEETSTGWGTSYEVGNQTVTTIRTQIAFTLGEIVAFSVLLTILDRARIRRFFNYLLAILALGLLLWSGGRMGAISAIIGIFAAIFMHFRNVKKLSVHLIIICFSIVTVFVAMAKFLPETADKILNTRWSVLRDERDNGRLQRWKAGIDQLKISPLGSGLSNSTVEGIYVHNEYIAMSISFGIIGGLGYLVLFSCAFGCARREVKYPGDRGILGAVGVAIVVTLFVAQMTDHFSANRTVYQIGWLCIALAATAPLSGAGSLINSKPTKYLFIRSARISLETNKDLNA